MAKQEKKVSDAEAAMTKYREDQNALSLGDRQNITIARLNALNETVTRQRTERMQKEATYNQLKSIDPASDAADAFPVVAANPGVVEDQEQARPTCSRRRRGCRRGICQIIRRCRSSTCRSRMRAKR